ncbi:hypothetical protein ACHWQZ_G010013 [Mnemiopsis leidyi]
MLSPYANSAVLASRAVKQTYKGLIAELYAIHNGQLSQTTRRMYNEVQESTKTQTETQDLSVLNERFAVANNYLTLLKNLRIQQELIEKYGKGELSTEQAANKVGLALPRVPPHPEG